MNIFMQGMRRSGTTIIYDVACQDNQLDPYYEPFAAGLFGKPGGGSGVQEHNLFEKIIKVREDFMADYPDKTLKNEDFNYGAPRDASLEVQTEMPDYCKDYIKYMASMSEISIFKFTRMYRKVRILKEIDPNAKFVHLLRDPRAVVTSYLLGRNATRKNKFDNDNYFFKESTTRNAWASEPIFKKMILMPEFSHLKNTSDLVKVLAIWKHTFNETYAAGKELFGDNYYILRHESLMGAPAETLEDFYGFLGLELPPHVIEWAQKNIFCKLKVFDPDNPLWDEAFESVGMIEEIKAAGYGGILSGGAKDTLPGKLLPYREDALMPTPQAAPQPAPKPAPQPAPKPAPKPVPKPVPRAANVSLLRRVKNIIKKILFIKPAAKSAKPFRLSLVKDGKEKLNIGLVSLWNNRGQATVSRYLRGLFDDFGHKTFILARPTSDNAAQPNLVMTDDIWAQKGVTRAKNNLITQDEYDTWIKDNSLDVVFFDQNTQIENIRIIRKSGVATIGRFVWEKFGERMIKEAPSAFDCIYSLTKCEQERYKTMGIESPLIQWGCHPELDSYVAPKKTDAIYYYFHGGLMGPRKPVRKLLEAFMRTDNPGIRLLIKCQGTRTDSEKFDDLITNDPRIILVEDDLPIKEHFELFSSCHVCLSPSRWEGLGQHFYEAIGFGLPIITNDIPPHNEYVTNNKTGILVKSIKCGQAASGIPTYDPDVADLARAIEKLSDPKTLEDMSKNTLELRDRLSWDATFNSIKKVFNL